MFVREDGGSAGGGVRVGKTAGDPAGTFLLGGVFDPSRHRPPYGERVADAGKPVTGNERRERLTDGRTGLHGANDERVGVFAVQAQRVAVVLALGAWR